ncbi:hypothetical protein PINS_up017639 [Pythium insidiosum]|nr:hypothetical protein PINS_up017639 [Pythium insidiosum]
MASSSGPTVPASFKYGATSDLATQFYARFLAGTPTNALELAELPSRVLDRLQEFRLTFDALPPLLQRAVLWDSGYVFAANEDLPDDRSKLVAVQTQGGTTMDKIVVSLDAFNGQGCTAQSCDQVGGGKWFKHKYCSGVQILRVASCAIDASFEGKGVASSMWSLGGEDTIVPDTVVRRHNWTDSDGAYLVMSIHTRAKSPIYGKCAFTDFTETQPTVGETTIPCHPMSKLSPAQAAKFAPPKRGALVDAWLKATAGGQESTPAPGNTNAASTPSPGRSPSENSRNDGPPVPSATDSSATTGASDHTLVIVSSALGAVIGVALIVLLLVVRRRKQRKNDDRSAVAVTGNSNQHQHQHQRDPDRDYRAMRSPVVDRPPRPHRLPTDSRTRSSGGGTRTVTTVTATSGGLSSGRPSEPMRPSGRASLWEDPLILACRISMDALQVGELLGRGSFGEVFYGTYNGRPVAVKRLNVQRRRDIKQSEAFLEEAKMMAGLEHERIVRLVGIAWTNVADISVVSEYMGGGDLRSALTEFAYQKRALGFDAEKIKIAYHIAHALTYLHSLEHVVLHRDLKSRNVMLTEQHDAKLTDFGIARERATDETMTACIGSSFWMAPEVMRGERYDEKADVFSFGVVLSELDTHELPYAHAQDANGKLREVVVIQLVSSGRLSVRFTPGAHAEMVAIGRACVTPNPKQRPNSAEVLHRVHQVWRATQQEAVENQAFDV